MSHPASSSDAVVPHPALVWGTPFLTNEVEHRLDTFAYICWKKPFLDSKWVIPEPGFPSTSGTARGAWCSMVFNVGTHGKAVNMLDCESCQMGCEVKCPSFKSDLNQYLKIHQVEAVGTDSSQTRRLVILWATAGRGPRASRSQRLTLHFRAWKGEPGKIPGVSKGLAHV